MAPIAARAGTVYVCCNQKDMVPVKQIEYEVYGDLRYNIPKAIFYLLKGDYRVSWEHPEVPPKLPRFLRGNYAN